MANKTSQTPRIRATCTTCGANPMPQPSLGKVCATCLQEVLHEAATGLRDRERTLWLACGEARPEAQKDYGNAARAVKTAREVIENLLLPGLK